MDLTKTLNEALLLPPLNNDGRGVHRLTLSSSVATEMNLLSDSYLIISYQTRETLCIVHLAQGPLISSQRGGVLTKLMSLSAAANDAY